MIKKCFIILLMLTGAPGLRVCLAQKQVNDSIARKLNKVIGDFRDQFRCPSVVMCLVQDKDIIFSSALGYTDMENKTPATIDALYPIMSVSKTFTATMLMQLAEKGAVGLNDDVRKYVPEYKVTTGSGEMAHTTLLQLATHTSGLPRNGPADVTFTVSWDKWVMGDRSDTAKWFATNEELLRSLQYVQLEYPPFHFIYHNDRHYSNLGYSVLGIALERAAGMPLQDYVVNNICKPLDMRHTGFLDSDRPNDLVARGYRISSVTRNMERTPAFRPNSAMAAGGIYSTARDMCKYISFQFAPSRVLSADSKAMMICFKIGWKPVYPYVMHEGAIPGYRSEVVFNPDTRMGWVILTNVNDIDFNPVNGQIAEIVNQLYTKPAAPEMTKYPGTYTLRGGYGKLKIFLKDDRLYSTYLQEMLADSAMVADGQQRFKVEDKHGNRVYYEFISDGNGGISALKLGQNVWYKE